MEQGAQALFRILLGALLLGALVVALHPAYRATALAIAHGRAESAPIWISNGAYYSEVELDDDHAD